MNMPGVDDSLAFAPLRAGTTRGAAACPVSTALVTTAARRAPESGFTRKSNAPSRIASIARDSEASAVATTTGSLASTSALSRSNCNPSTSGNCRSSSMAPNAPSSLNARIAPAPVSTTTASKPAFERCAA